MKLWTTALTAGAIAASALCSQVSTSQEMPPWMIGSLNVSATTSSPLRVARSVNLDATPSEVFALISDTNQLPQLSGMINSVELEGSGESGSLRTVTLVNGAVASERIVAFDEPTAQQSGVFAWSVTPDNPIGVQDHLGIIEVRPTADGGSAVLYYQAFQHEDPAAVAPMVAGFGEGILKNLTYTFGGEQRGAIDQAGQTVLMTQRRVVDTSATRSWQVLAEQWGDVDQWSSVVTASETKGAQGKGMTRSCTVPGTPGFRETMLRYDEDARVISYQALEGMPPFVTKAVNTWTITPLGDSRAVVMADFQVDVAPGTPEPAVGMVKQQFSQLLDLTTDELVHFLETGKPHPRVLAVNQR